MATLTETGTVAQRVYAIRLALGDGWKTALPMSEFADRLNKTGAETRYDSSVISRLENGERKLTLADVSALASVDPMRRGKLWVGWGEKRDPMLAEEPVYLGKIPDEAAEAASRARAAKLATKRAAESPPVRKVSGGRRRKDHPTDDQ